MQLIILSRDKGHLGQFSVRRLWLCAFLVTAVACAVTFFAGYRAAEAFGANNPDDRIAEWQTGLADQEAQLASMREDLQQNLDALALRLGQMNAHVVRLDALGARLTQMADLADGEFDFSAAPPLGGPQELALVTGSNQLDKLVDTLGLLEQQLSDRGQQLSLLEDLLLNRKLADEIHPEGRPVTTGYVSSGFGERTDPFTGRPDFHQGVDFVGREGNDVVAVASGIVTWSGSRSDYGQMVELNHGNGYVTRYAHNTETLVAVGDTVKRGDVIAHMGDTGRATGPHLHFEVLQDGHRIDPLSVIN